MFYENSCDSFWRAEYNYRAVVTADAFMYTEWYLKLINDVTLTRALLKINSTTVYIYIVYNDFGPKNFDTLLCILG